MEKFEGVAFDLEGTVIDVEFVHHNAHVMVAAEAGVTINLDDLEDVLKKIPHFIGGPDDKVAEEIREISNGHMTTEEILRRKKQYYDLWIMDVDDVKPAMDIYLKTAERMGIDPSRQLVFEDSPNGIRAAIRAGSVAVGMPVYNRPPVIAALLEAGAKKIFTDWRSVNIDGLMKGEFESPRNIEKR